MANIFESLRLALQTFSTHKMRTFLTGLGIIIGVSTVITILSLIEGLNRSVAAQIKSLGSNTILVMKVAWTMGRIDIEQVQKRRDFTMDDVEAVRKLPSVDKVAPGLGNRRVPWLYYKDKKVNDIEAEGMTSEYYEANNFSVTSGRSINESDVLHRRMVCNIGDYIVENLFPNESPIGQALTVRGKSLKVVGVLAKKGSFLGQSMDNLILMPITAIDKIFPRPQGFQAVFQSLYFAVVPKDPKNVEKTVDEVRELMRRRRGLTMDKPDDFGKNRFGK